MSISLESLRRSCGAWSSKLVGVPGGATRLTDLASLFSSNVVSNAILFGGIWLLGRLVQPDEFGRFSIAAAFALAITPLLTLRLEQAIPVAAGEAAARAMTLLCFALMGGLSVSFYFAATLGLSFGLGGTLLPPVVAELLLPTLGLIASLSVEKVVQSVTLRLGELRKLAALRILRAVALVGLQLLLVFAIGANAGALLGGQLVANAAVALLLAAQVGCLSWLVDAGSWRSLPRRVPSLLCRFSRFPLVNMPHVVVHSLLSAAYGLLIGTLYGSAAVGQFYMMHRVLFGAIDLIAAALHQQGIAEAATREPGRLQAVSMYIVVALLAVTLPLALVVMLAGEQAFAFVLGESWAQAGQLAAASIPRIVMEPLAAALAFLPNFLDKQRQAFAWSIVQNATGLLLLLAAHRLGCDVVTAIGISATGMATVMLAFVIWLSRMFVPARVRT